ncbi:MAG: inorganic phosphate transporter [Elusimicrobia bacterium]|nr:inorganic phosphate transporter [Elusimicrobiota bacterium]
MAALLLLLTLALAFANGANDVSKGIATLVGSGVAEYRKAVRWGTLWTALGGLAAIFASQGLVAAFSGKGLLVEPRQGHEFLIAVACGAFLWVLFASKSSLPVSTTHAITGALCGAGAMAAGPDGVEWLAVAKKFALPLFAGPILSLLMMFILAPAIAAAFGGFQNYCLCVEAGKGVCLKPAGTAAVAVEAEPPKLVLGEASRCGSEPAVLAQVNGMDALHWLAAGTTSFARGLNDTPKIFAVGAAAAAALGVGQTPMYFLVALAMGAGSAIWGLRVTETLATKVTKMSHAEGFSANLVTSLLVTFASRLALPVSTTHVSSGAIIGIGLKGGQEIQWKTVRDMGLAWIVTLPVSAAFAAVSCLVVSRF